MTVFGSLYIKPCPNKAVHMKQYCGINYSKSPRYDRVCVVNTTVITTDSELTPQMTVDIKNILQYRTVYYSK